MRLREAGISWRGWAGIESFHFGQGISLDIMKKIQTSLSVYMCVAVFFLLLLLYDGNSLERAREQIYCTSEKL